MTASYHISYASSFCSTVCPIIYLQQVDTSTVPPYGWLPYNQSVWQQQSLASVPPFTGQYSSPNQPPPPSYYQFFGESGAERLPKHQSQNVVQPDVKVAAAKAPKELKVGMKVEAVDRRFPYFVCAATIADAREKNSEVLIQIDAWAKVGVNHLDGSYKSQKVLLHTHMCTYVCKWHTYVSC